MTEPALTALVLSAIGLLLLLAALVSPLPDRLGIPALLLFLLVGITAGSEGIGGIPFDDYSLYDQSVVELPTVLFTWGDPDAGGVLLGFGTFDAGLTEIPARGDAIARLVGLVPPTGIDVDSKIYVTLIHNGSPPELRSGIPSDDNNVAWNFAGFRSLPACSNGFDDDTDGYVDFPDDPDCVNANDGFEVPEPGFAAALAAGALALAHLRRRRGEAWGDSDARSM